MVFQNHEDTRESAEKFVALCDEGWDFLAAFQQCYPKFCEHCRGKVTVGDMKIFAKDIYYDANVTLYGKMIIDCEVTEARKQEKRDARKCQ